MAQVENEFGSFGDVRHMQHDGLENVHAPSLCVEYRLAANRWRVVC